MASQPTRLVCECVCLRVCTIVFGSSPPLLLIFCDQADLVQREGTGPWVSSFLLWISLGVVSSPAESGCGVLVCYPQWQYLCVML